MLDEEFGLMRAFEATANAAIDDLLERIMTGDNPEEAKALLKLLALQYPEDSPHAVEALSYYRGMRAALSEDRWFVLESNEQERKKQRRERLRQYHRYRELFEIEVEATRNQKASVMAIRRDWSQIGKHVRDAFTPVRCRFMLWLAGRLYRLGIPGALDMCDAGAFELFRSAYLQP